jgi:pimeloyl-ACP methyl ester carboxylesterase
MISPIRFRTEEGLALCGEIEGPGGAPLVVLLHGGGQTRHAWTALATRLSADGFAVLRYDARGHGDSDWSPAGDYQMARFARDLSGVLAEFGRPAVLIGASLGGVSALLAAAEAPQRVRALVLVDIVPRFAPAGVERIRQFMQGHPDGFASLEDAVAAVRAYNPHRPPPKDPQGLLRSLRERDGRLHWHWDPAILGAPPGATLFTLLSERLAALPPALPLLLVSGADSDVVDPAALEEFRRQAPRAETIVVDRAGHMVAGDRNDAFGDAIAAFLQRI